MLSQSSYSCVWALKPYGMSLEPLKYVGMRHFSFPFRHFLYFSIMNEMHYALFTGPRSKPTWSWSISIFIIFPKNDEKRDRWLFFTLVRYCDGNFCHISFPAFQAMIYISIYFIHSAFYCHSDALLFFFRDLPRPASYFEWSSYWYKP